MLERDFFQRLHIAAPPPWLPVVTGLVARSVRAGPPRSPAAPLFRRRAHGGPLRHPPADFRQLHLSRALVSRGLGRRCDPSVARSFLSSDFRQMLAEADRCWDRDDYRPREEHLSELRLPIVEVNIHLEVVQLR